MADFVAGRGTEAMSIVGMSAAGLALLGQWLGGAGRAVMQTANGQQAAPAMPNIVVLGDTGSAGSGNCSKDTVSKETFDLALRLSNSERDNAILTAELASEKKMSDVFTTLNDKINQVVTNQTAINSAQAVTNCAVTSQLAVLNNNVATLMGLTKTVIPNGNVCPGWGDVTVSVGTTTAAA